METPEEILEAVLRLKFPDVEVNWSEVIRLTVQFGGLIRGPTVPTPKRTKSVATAPAPESEAPKALASPPKGGKFISKSARIEAILREGRPIGTNQMAKLTGASPALVQLVSRQLRATKIGKGERGETIWKLDKKTGPRLHADTFERKVQLYGREMALRLKGLLTKEPMSATKAGLTLGVSAHVVERLAKTIGAHRIGTSNATMKWTLQPARRPAKATRQHWGQGRTGHYGAYGPETADKVRAVLELGPASGKSISTQLGISDGVVKRFAQMLGAHRIGNRPHDMKWVLPNGVDHNGEASNNGEAVTHE